MAWCENLACAKDGLRKADVEFDESTRRVLCHGCMTLVHPGWLPPSEYVDLSDGSPHVIKGATAPKFGMALQMNELEGVKAMFSYGQISLTICIPQEDFQKLFGA